MREFMKIVEARMVDGYISGPSQAELVQLLDRKGDLRGVATDSEVFITSADTDIHFYIRGNLGLPTDEHDVNGKPTPGYGFNFYVAHLSVADEHELGQSEVDDLNGRDDWLACGRETTAIAGTNVGVWCDVEEAVALTNRQYARMVGK